ncbi:PEGA domain-containing protein [candidate division WWE3 bacterium]|uniref:PEGA domain-containing protein n=1 Tax=candidate division WWE3 bacterium TaxID=2053526 RepID=A0A955RPF9_UNCKA|nr:PEGA domain-containing protein [candidate division WWE3 bacterium]
MTRYKAVITVLLTLILLLTASTAVMFFARGYQFDVNDRNLKQTGILSLNSTPTGALIYINDVPQDVTDNSITGLKEATYTVRLEKSGYHTWTKDVQIVSGEVNQVHALLISSFPEIKPLTITGAQSPTMSPDRQRMIYSVNTENAQNQDGEQQKGLWVLDLAGRPFNILNRPNLLIADTDRFKYSQGNLTWSADSQSVLIKIDDVTYFLIDIQSKDTTQLVAKDVNELLAKWDDEQKQNDELLRERFSTEVQALLPSTSSVISWSPDQTKILFSEENDQKIVYKIIDLNPKEYTDLAKSADGVKTYTVHEKEKDNAGYITWYPDSKHVLVFEPTSADDTGQVSIMEIEGTNKISIYSGKVLGGLVYPHPDGSRVIIQTNFTDDSSQSNLYSVSVY